MKLIKAPWNCIYNNWVDIQFFKICLKLFYLLMKSYLLKNIYKIINNTIKI